MTTNCDRRPSLSGYELIETLYQGSKTEVYRAIRLVDRQAVVIKLLRQEYPTFGELLHFRNQYTIAKNLQSLSIIRPLCLETYRHSYALVMEDFGGISLPEYTKTHALELTDFLEIALQLTDILHSLYQNRIIHKDIKPANILIHPETQQVKVIDFSISSLLPRETQEIQNANVLEGTLAYLSPEQTGRMNRGIDYRSDFYSLGVSFYELLTGKLPFVSDDPMELVHCHLAKLPVPVHQIDVNMPLVISEIVSKLMAKNAEDRYQSALGLKHDLEKCRSQWQETGKIEYFEIGKRDICDRFIIPEKLYGRATEVAQLLAAFDRVANGASELMLVAGFSGIGKTAVVNEVHKPITRQQGYFIKGKFDQFNRNIPLSAFVQALRDLMEQLLSESDAQLQTWKAKILSAVGDNGQVLIDVIPELELIIGQQPISTELSGSAAQNRFNLLFQKFIEVFTTAEHPLVVFLDDLQWADSASLQLIKLLMSDNSYLLMLGAYRDNEVSPVHPFILTVEEIRKANAIVNTITLTPLDLADTNHLVADTLNCSRELAQPLTELIDRKTQGNPFFTTQFLKALHDDGQITFNRDRRYWECNIAQVNALALTDDVVEFMALQLQKLSPETQQVLKLAACVGNQFDLSTLAIVSERSPTEAATALWKALQEGLILPTSQIYKFFQGTEQSDLQNTVNPTYRFLHDRVQQAAYSLIPEEQKQTTHYHIGQLLLKQISPEAQEERIFELLNQLNYGKTLIREQIEHDELAQLNLIACRKAKASTAYQAAREYANVGLSLLGETAWKRQYKMTLTLHELAAEIASLCGQFEHMEKFINIVITQTHSLLEKINVYRIRILSNVAQNKLLEAIAIAQNLLQQLGVTFPETPTQKDTEQAIQEIAELIADRKITDFVRLPLMTNAEKIAIVQIANSIFPAAYTCGSPLLPLLAPLTVKLSIQYGNITISAFSYVAYSVILCNLFQDINTATEFGKLALEIASQVDGKAIKPEVFNVWGAYLLHRKSHLKETLPILQEGYASALEVGKLDQAQYIGDNFCLNAFCCGQPLSTLEEDTRNYYNSLVQLSRVVAVNWCRIHRQSIFNLLGSAEHPTIFSGEVLQDAEVLPWLLSTNDWHGLSLFYLYKLMLGYLFGEIEPAQNYAIECRRYLMGIAGNVGEVTFYFYDSLIALAQLSKQPDEISVRLEQVEQNQAILAQHWAYYAPMNHQHKVDLVEAEKYRFLGKNYEAGDWYDRAISGAKENGFIQEEALANELAAKFYLNWGKEKIAASYMQDAYYGYARWGAKAKVQDLERRYPQLLAPILQQQQMALSATETVFSTISLASSQTSATQSSTSGSTSISAALDLATVLKASQALSSEIQLDKLLVTLLHTVLENAGADKGALLMPRDHQWFVEAVATVDQPAQIQAIALSSGSSVPQSLINTVKRSREPVVVVDALLHPTLATDAYVLQQQPKSVLCTPILNQGKLVAILYLENRVTVGAFTRDRVELLNFLCTQAAISLENARLYQQAQTYAQQLEQSQLQIVQSEKMASLGNLVAGVAHEINNPIGFLNGSINNAKDYVQDLLDYIALYQQHHPNAALPVQEKAEDIDLEFLAEDLPKLLDSMQGATDRIKSISTSLRTFSRADTEHKVSANLHEGIDSTLLILKYRLKANENRSAIEVIQDYGDLPIIPCFPGQLNQVFMNILANAIDALEESNTGRSYADITINPNQIIIKTELSSDREQAIIRIKDNGKGMTEEVKQKIFDHLFTTKEVGKGTGLGLAIARQIIVEKHSGILEVNSALGQGTEFAILLPLKS